MGCPVAPGVMASFLVDARPRLAVLRSAGAAGRKAKLIGANCGPTGGRRDPGVPEVQTVARSGHRPAADGPKERGSSRGRSGQEGDVWGRANSRPSSGNTGCAPWLKRLSGGLRSWQRRRMGSRRSAGDADFRQGRSDAKVCGETCAGFKPVSIRY